MLDIEMIAQSCVHSLSSLCIFFSLEQVLYTLEIMIFFN
jgi:hypothetical protein